jgi:crotonobetainyl-CoA:carnitine CoA-transferase CaiB-like acyl-CoA transferase
MSGPLNGIRVVDLSSTLVGAQVTQTMCDFGCEVVMVEPPGGHPLRDAPAWPFWGRGKRSLVLNLKNPTDAASARSLASNADVVIETWRPGVADRLGLGYETLAERNRGLVYASVTGFGRDNPLSHLKGYEAVVMAKIGAFDAFSLLSDRPGPSFVASPYCSFSASQLALHGVLSALLERESSGLGQHVETNLVQGVLAHDTWNWLIRLMINRYPGAFSAAPPTSAGAGGPVPNSPLFLRLMVGFSKDGRFMQFSQMSERLWQAFLRLTGLGQLIDDPEWTGGRTPEDPEMRVKWLDRAIEVTRSKTYDEWLSEFDREPDVWAEMFRYGSELLHHPQLVQDGRVTTIEDPVLGPVLQPGPLVAMEATPATLRMPAPTLDGDHSLLSSLTEGSASTPSVVSSTPAEPPLAGVTIIELGTYYAAPFGATVLTDLGARVIKVEQLDGDPIRSIIPFPEVGGIKVLQGKESVAVDIASEAGREIVLELVRRADVVLQSFRSGVAERHGYTAADLLAVNPDLVYLNAPGYGVGKPYGQRPAFAPTIGAGSGLAYRNLGGPANVPSDSELSTEQVRLYSTRLAMATMTVGQADGFSALGVGTALLLGLLAKRRGAPGQEMSTSMISTMTHCLSEDMVEYEGRRPIPAPSRELLGLSARYRLYQSADGWVFLAAPHDDEWASLATALDLDPAMAEDDASLADVLSARFATASSAEWESTLSALDVTCVEVAAGPVEEVVWFGGGLGKTLDIVTEAHHAILETYPRLAPLVRFSRSSTVAGGAPLCGDHTEAVLTELGYDSDRITALRSAGAIG